MWVTAERVREENSSEGEDMASITRRSRDILGTYAHSKHKSERGRSIAFPGGPAFRRWRRPPLLEQSAPASADGCRKPLLQGDFFERAKLFPAAGPDTSVRSGDIFDHDGLPKRAAHSLGKNSTERVKEAAGSERQDHGDWSRRIALRLRDARRHRQHGGTRCQMQKVPSAFSIGDTRSSLLHPAAPPLGSLTQQTLHLSTRRFCSDNRDQLSSRLSRFRDEGGL